MPASNDPVTFSIHRSFIEYEDLELIQEFSEINPLTEKTQDIAYTTLMLEDQTKSEPKVIIPIKKQSLAAVIPSFSNPSETSALIPQNIAVNLKKQELGGGNFKIVSRITQSGVRVLKGAGVIPERSGAEEPQNKTIESVNSPISKENFLLFAIQVLIKVEKQLEEGKELPEEYQFFINFIQNNTPLIIKYKIILKDLSEKRKEPSLSGLIRKQAILKGIIEEKEGIKREIEVALANSYVSAEDEIQIAISRVVVFYAKKERYALSEKNSSLDNVEAATQKFKSEEIVPAELIHQRLKNSSNVTINTVATIEGLGQVLIAKEANVGALSEVISKLSSGQKFDLLLKAAKGLRAMHRADLTHGDISARNILVSAKPDKSGQFILDAEVNDFGFATALTDAEIYHKRDGVMPLFWMPKEVLVDSNFYKKSDVYSFAVMILECLRGTNYLLTIYPENFDGSQTLIQAIMAGEWEAFDRIDLFKKNNGLLNCDIHSELETLLEKALDQNVETRIDSNQLVEELENLEMFKDELFNSIINESDNESDDEKSPMDYLNKDLAEDKADIIYI